jgi:hypothetical protein
MPEPFTHGTSRLPLGVAAILTGPWRLSVLSVSASTEVKHVGSKVHRYYFHLTDGHKVIPDEVGVSVSDLAEARAEAIREIREFRRELSEADADWRGWRIEVTDAAGFVAFTIDLESIQEGD